MAAALLAGIIAAFSVGVLVPEILAGLLGIDSNTVRLALKVVAVAFALPVMFYLVERFFSG
jgi:type III secretory pathway component EscS